MNARECVFRAHVYTYVCPTCTQTCVHFCVPTRHVILFQENTCLLSNEYSCVSVFLRANVSVHVCNPRVCVCVRVPFCTCVCSRVHMCVPHVYTYMCVHVYTYARATWTRVCVPGGQVCVPREHMTMCYVNMFSSYDIFSLQVCTCMCSRKRMIVFEVRTCVCVRFRRAFMLAHACTYVCSTCAHMCALLAQFTCVPREFTSPVQAAQDAGCGDPAGAGLPDI